MSESYTQNTKPGLNQKWFSTGSAQPKVVQPNQKWFIFGSAQPKVVHFWFSRTKSGSAEPKVVQPNQKWFSRTKSGSVLVQPNQKWFSPTKSGSAEPKMVHFWFSRTKSGSFLVQPIFVKFRQWFRNFLKIKQEHRHLSHQFGPKFLEFRNS